MLTSPPRRFSPKKLDTGYESRHNDGLSCTAKVRHKLARQLRSKRHAGCGCRKVRGSCKGARVVFQSRTGANDRIWSKRVCRFRQPSRSRNGASQIAGKLEECGNGKSGFSSSLRFRVIGFVLPGMSYTSRRDSELCRGVAKLVKAPDFDSGMRGFESFLPCHSFSRVFPLASSRRQVHDEQ